MIHVGTYVKLKDEAYNSFYKGKCSNFPRMVMKIHPSYDWYELSCFGHIVTFEDIEKIYSYEEGEKLHNKMKNEFLKELYGKA